MYRTDACKYHYIFVGGGRSSYSGSCVRTSNYIRAMCYPLVDVLVLVRKYACGRRFLPICRPWINDELRALLKSIPCWRCYRDYPFEDLPKSITDCTPIFEQRKNLGILLVHDNWYFRSHILPMSITLQPEVFCVALPHMQIRNYSLKHSVHKMGPGILLGPSVLPPFRLHGLGSVAGTHALRRPLDKVA